MRGIQTVTVVTAAQPSDAEVIATLAEEMDRFYGAPPTEPREVRLRQIREALFTDHPSAHAMLAWEGNDLIGFAAYSFLWPAAGLTRSLFLKELYVAEAARRSGVGRQLMQALFEIAVKQDCSRVEWQTETDNVDARGFYAGLGVSEHKSKVFYRLEGEHLQRAASGSKRE
jgi:ribosomal protein S18 acetylase RimI-like enzyme